jgi:hypothetical protein
MTKLNPFKTDGVDEKLSWEKPERKDQAGSLIIFGGASLKLKEVDSIFKSAKKYGVGQVSALVPESLSKVFKREDPYLIPLLYDSHFGLSDQGLRTFQDEFSLSDSLVLADLGRSSSTQLKIASQVAKSFKPVIITNSGFSLLNNFHTELLSNGSITVLLNLQNLQKLISVAKLNTSSPLLSSSSFKQIIDSLFEISNQIKAKIVLLEDGRIFSVNNSQYLNLKQEKTSEEFIAALSSWQIWSPKLKFLEQVFAASTI